MTKLKCVELLTNAGTFQVQESVEEAKEAVKNKEPLTKLSGRNFSINGVDYVSEEKLHLTDEVKVMAYSEIDMETIYKEEEVE